ncbi:hypothetical protein OH492_14780 [Vibrio chagasii]|nr:hypothetical protein [Vibrio chagasii]
METFPTRVLKMVCRLLKWDKHSPLQGWNIIGRNGKPAFIAATAHSLGVTRHHILVFAKLPAQVRRYV